MTRIFINKINKKSLFVKVAKINIITFILLLLFLLYNNYYINSRIEQQKREYSNEQFGIIRDTLLTEVERLKTICLSLSYDKNVERLVKSSKYSVNEIAGLVQVKTAIGLVKASLPYSVTFHIAIKNCNMVISDDGTYSPDAFSILIKRKYSLPNSYEQDFNNVEEGFHVMEGFVLYCIKPNPDMLIYIDMPQRSLSDYILQQASSDNNYFAVYDEKKSIVVKSKKIDGIFSQDFNSILSNDASKIKYRDKYYSFIKSDAKFNGLDLTFANIYSLDKFQKIYKASTKYTFLVALLFIAMNCFVIMYQYKVYNPIMKLARKIKQFENSGSSDELTTINTAIDNLHEKNEHMQEIINQTRNVHIIQAMYNLLRGQSENIEPDVILELNEKFKSYLVVFAMFDSNFDITKDFETAIGDYWLSEKIMADSNSRVYIIKCSDDRAFLNSIRNIFDELEDNNKPICGVSNLFKGINNLCEAYIQSYQNIYTCRIGEIINNPVCLYDASFHGESYAVSSQEEQALVNFVIRGNTKEVEKFFDSHFANMTNVTYKNFKRIYEYMINLLEKISYIKNIDIPIIDINSLVSVYNVHTYVKSKFVEIAEYCGSQSLDLYDKIIEFVKDNYTSDLSSVYIAEKFNITPEYLSSYFKKNSGYNLSTYINELRITQAIKLMTERKNFKVSDIATEVGMDNINTFTRQFKLYTGITPGKFKDTI